MKLNVKYLVMGLLLITGCDFLKTTTGHAVMEYVMQTIVLIVTPILLLLAKRVVQIVEQKTGLTATAQQIQLIDDAVYRGVAYAEEQGRKALKLNEDLPPGELKRQMAVEFALDMVKNHKAAELSRDYLMKLVEAQVNLQRDPHAGRTIRASI